MSRFVVVIATCPGTVSRLLNLLISSRKAPSQELTLKLFLVTTCSNQEMSRVLEGPLGKQLIKLAGKDVGSKH